MSDKNARGMILPLMTGARADEVEQRIYQAILLGLLSDGQQLPAETVFASKLGVSPATLRDALASLREQGIVETKRGRSGGTFVLRPADPLESDLWNRLRHTSVSTLRDLADEHAAISGMSAQLAAERASVGDVGQLRGLIDQLAKADSLGSRIRADSRFHIDMAAASYSERLKQREVSLQGEVGDLLWVPHQPEWDSAQAVRDHRAIALAIANEDGASARNLTELHIQSNFRRLTELHFAISKSKSKKGKNAGPPKVADEKDR